MLPQLTHLQALAVDALTTGDRSGRELRDELRKQGAPMSGAAFYQMMARLEEGDLVRGRYVVKVVDGQTIKERWYRISARGERAIRRIVEFYAARAAAKQPAMI